MYLSGLHEKMKRNDNDDHDGDHGDNDNKYA
jgi:hypothetical protein